MGWIRSSSACGLAQTVDRQDQARATGLKTMGIRWSFLMMLAAAKCHGQPPPGYGPLWTESHVEDLRNRLNDVAHPDVIAKAISELRQHGWELLGKVMADSRRPDWYWRWCTI